MSLSVLSGPATVSNSEVLLNGAGTVVLAGNQAGNSNYLSAQQVITQFIVAKGHQSITFGDLSPVSTRTTPFSLRARASSGLPVSYTSSNTNVAVVSSNIVTILGVGKAKITASQSGDPNYTAAASVQRVLKVIKATHVIPLESMSP